MSEKLSSSMYEILGQGHVLKSALRSMHLWRADPNFIPDPEIKRAEEAVGEYHKRLCTSIAVVDLSEAALKLEIECRDAAIKQLAEYHDDETMEAEFHGLVAAFKERKQAHAFSEALTA